MSRALVVGESLIDRISAAGVTYERPGGSPLNVAVGLARLGIKTTLATQYADDLGGEAIELYLAANGVDVWKSQPQDGCTSWSRATVGASGDVTYDFDVAWTRMDLPNPHDFDVVHVGSIAATMKPGAEAVAELCSDAVATGVPFTFDPNVRLGITQDMEDIRARATSLAESCTVLKVSSEDLMALWPTIGTSTDPARSLRQRFGSTLVVLTHGRRGLELCSRRQAAEVAARAAGVGGDTVGAGDSVMSALLAWLTETNIWVDVAQCDLMRLGEICAQAASITCSRPGSDPPRRHELDYWPGTV